MDIDASACGCYPTITVMLVQLYQAEADNKNDQERTKITGSVWVFP